jgi:hypothetical protein
MLISKMSWEKPENNREMHHRSLCWFAAESRFVGVSRLGIGENSEMDIARIRREIILRNEENEREADAKSFMEVHWASMPKGNPKNREIAASRTRCDWLALG